jgi:hypothetical protein
MVRKSINRTNKGGNRIMKVDWTRVPDWIDWVAPASNNVNECRCYGWSAKPYIEECLITGLEFTNWACTADDGLYCELPHDVAIREDSDLLDFENAIAERPEVNFSNLIFHKQQKYNEMLEMLQICKQTTSSKQIYDEIEQLIKSATEL